MTIIVMVVGGRGSLQAAGSGTTQQDAGLSCKAIMTAGLSTGDGLYWIDPNGGDHADAFQAYCDMTTDGGGWTLGVNSVAGEEPITNDMTSNTGVPGIDRGHTRDLTNLAINNDAQIRYSIDDPLNGRLFHARIASRYHYPLQSFDRWTPLAGHLPGSDTLLTPEFGRIWSTSLSDRDSLSNGSCSALSGNVPWYYADCWSSIPSNPTNGFTQGPEAGGITLTRFSIFVREVGTIAAFPDPASPAKFRPAVNLPTGTGPGRVTAGDFDQDGRPDVVTVNPGNNTVTVRFSAGGVAQFPAGLTEFPPGSTQPGAIAVGDFNGDSRLDLVVTYGAAFSRAVVFANTGSGFAPMATIRSSTCIGFSGIEAADFDRNGTTDLAYTCRSVPGIGIASGNGDGSFAAGPFMPTSSMAVPDRLAVADFNGDARPDIIGFSEFGCVAVMMNFGSFSVSEQCFGTTPLFSGAIGDFNNDARPDVAVTTSSAVQLLQNVDGTQFTPASSYSLPAGIGEIAVGDVDNDGRQDVIAVPGTLRAVAVFSGNGDLTLQPVPALFNVSSPPRSVAVADFDVDGWLDIASTDNATDSVSLLYNSVSVNDAPIASDGAITATEGAARSGTLSAFDPNGEAITFALVTGGSKGTATLTNAATGAFTYAANAGADGTDTFTFTASDGVNTSNVGTITVTIGPKQIPVVTWMPRSPIHYGRPLLLEQLNASSAIDGSFAYSPGFFTVLGAGASQTLTVTFTPLDSANYTSVTKSVTIDVLPAGLVVRTNDATIVFGQPPPPFGVTYAGFVNGDTPASLDGSLTFTGPSGTNAGSYPITPAGLRSVNYAIDFQPGTLTIHQASTTTVLSASSTAVGALQPFKLTATVGVVAPGAGVPTGTVTFFDGATRVGTAASSGGVATLTLTGYVQGAHAFTATYDGDANFASSTSAPADVTVRELAQSTLTFAFPLNAQTFVGQRVTLGAVVVALAGSVTPTGSVAFLDGGTLLGTAPLSGGKAFLPTDALPVGSRFIFAVYLGNAAWAPSVSSPAAYNVYTGTAPLTGPMTLTSPVAPTPLGDPIRFHVAILSPSDERPTGTVVFLADNTLLGTAQLSNVDGLTRAELTTSALPAGVHLVSAIYVGDGVFGAIAAGPVLREVR